VPEAWSLVSRVLDVLPTASLSARLEVTTGPVDKGRQWEETPPDSPAEQEGWARHWAGQRMSAKLARDFATADRLRKLLHDNGFEVRDRKDGVVEVVRR
jgi:cysteinyl-tRNA synthetase